MDNNNSEHEKESNSKKSIVQHEFVIEGVFFHGAYTVESILNTKSFVGRPDDIYLSTYPRTGTTWTQNVLVGLCYGLEVLSKTGQIDMRKLFPYLELFFIDEGSGLKLAEEVTATPRLLKTHLSAQLAPQEIFSHKRKNIIVVRNPKATALSVRNFYASEPTLQSYHQNLTLTQFLDLFLEGRVFYGSWWSWTKNWIDAVRASPENHLLIHYEDLHSNFEDTVSKIAHFVGKDNMTSEQIAELKRMTHVDEMKKRYEAKSGGEKGMVNKGEKERWKSEIPQEYIDKFDQLTKTTFGDNSELLTKFI